MPTYVPPGSARFSFWMACHTFNEAGVEIAIFDGNHRCYAEWAEKLA